MTDDDVEDDDYEPSFNITLRSFADLPQSNGGQTVVSSDFSNQYLKPLTTGNNGNLVVFVQDKLSLQDFTQHADVYNPESDGGVFKNVKGFMDELSSLSLPSVHLPGLAIDDIIKTFEGKVHQVKDQDASKIDFDSKLPNLVIVKLTSISDSPNEEEGFRKNDETIGRVVKQLAKRGVKYSALYTATSSKAVSVHHAISDIAKKGQHYAESNKVRTRRGLLSVGADNSGTFIEYANGTLYNSSCILMYVRSINIGNSTQLNDTKSFTMTNHSCVDNQTASLAFTYKNNSEIIMTMSLIMNVNNVSGYWSIDNATVNWNETTYNVTLSKVSAPWGFSYHCSSLEKLVARNSEFTMSLEGFQLQPFDVMDYKFSDGWDCVPFFSEVIWMGLIATLAFVLILLFGFSMLASVTTQDRFDDPKGKTITVNVNE
uniref:V-type proton ATPase subunit S1 n=1 Tax=Magallana gigas TaxID=29159 RepID=K1RE19_MAGGI